MGYRSPGKKGTADFKGAEIEERGNLAQIKNPWGKLTPGQNGSVS
jgi:hypothetical protein